MIPPIKKIIKAGWEKLIHDKSSSSAAFAVMAAVLAMITFVFFLNGMSKFIVSNLQNSIDISAYFKEDTQEDDIVKLKAELLTIPQVQDAAYVSKDAAYKDFAARHQQDQTILDSLDVIGANPFLSSLHIRAKDPAQYATIVDFLQQSSSSSLIEKIDYTERASIIAKVSQTSRGIQIGALALSIALAFLALLVAFNTIRLTIINSKEEIEIMRLVGASNWFIQGPFLAQGVMVGVFGAITVFVLLLPAIVFLSPMLEQFLSGFSFAKYFWSHLFILVLLQVGVGAGIGVVSSMIAIRKYLKV